MRSLFYLLLIFSFTANLSFAGIWEEKCSDCHGVIAPKKETLLSKFKTADELAIKAQGLANKDLMPKLDFRKAAEELFSKKNFSNISGNSVSSGSLTSPTAVSTVETVLGKMLFFETRLSKNKVISCNNCHNISSGGDDNNRVSYGFGWRKTTRNAPTVFNAGFLKVFGWDGKTNSLEEMIKGEILDSSKLNCSESEVVSRLKSIPEYVVLFRKVFPDDADAVTLDNVAKVIASYIRTLSTFNSKFDRFVAGDERALSEEAQLGMELFKSKGCNKCHSGSVFTDENFHRFRRGGDPGRFKITNRKKDLYYFKTPSLRNVALTAPYFHDGSVSKLDIAVKTMASLMLGQKLTDVEAWRIKTYLETLTSFPSIDSRIVPVLPQKDD